ncbi:hypothetical protein ACHAWF_009886 [Thalassiosira exigua]
MDTKTMNCEREEDWIESPDGWGQDDDEGKGDGSSGLLDLFGNDNQNENFTFNVKIQASTTKQVRLNGFKLDSNETARSTGVTLWQAAPRLAGYLQENAVICKAKSILELGAGLGLCGITASLLGAKDVTMTDGDTQTLQQMRANVQENCGGSENTTGNAISCRQLIWGAPHMETFSAQYGKFDVILGADVIYTEESVKPLFDTVAHLLKSPHGNFVLSRYSKWNNVDDLVVIEAARIRCLSCDRPSDGIFVFHWNEGARS